MVWSVRRFTRAGGDKRVCQLTSGRNDHAAKERRCDIVWCFLVYRLHLKSECFAPLGRRRSWEMFDDEGLDGRYQLASPIAASTLVLGCTVHSMHIPATSISIGVHIPRDQLTHQSGSLTTTATPFVQSCASDCPTYHQQVYQQHNRGTAYTGSDCAS